MAGYGEVLFTQFASQLFFLSFLKISLYGYVHLSRRTPICMCVINMNVMLYTN